VAEGQPETMRQLPVAVARTFPALSRRSASAKTTRRPGLVTHPCARVVPDDLAVAFVAPVAVTDR